MAGGNSEQVGIAADGPAPPAGPLNPDPAPELVTVLDPTEPLEP